MERMTFSRRSFMASLSLGTAAGFAGSVSVGESNSSAGYEPSWESLDRHTCPEWFHDAKLGMYFHWGLSSVPGWAPRSTSISYAEWYWHAMNDPKNPTWKYHRETYGDRFAYDDFIPLFTAKNYDPAHWVEFAKNSGMRYVFMNSKHHDGFCLWPSKVTNRTSSAMGPKRDFIGEFVEAAHKAELKVGFYYSFYEWYNPLYTGKPMLYAGLIEVKNYVDDFMAPQVRELIDWYHPDFLYFDGEWDHPSEFWKSRDLVAYYYNQAAKRGQEVLVNDRFGKESRGKHGDLYNVEYHFGIESEGLLSHKWSYWRGVGNTYGYNRDMNPQDCLSPKELIHMVVNGVSRNGNFDLNVGPDAEGAVSDVESEPITALGKWLAVNGEAVYDTRPWNVTGEGDIRYTSKGEYIYAIFLSWQGAAFRIPSVRAVEGSDITMLGAPGKLEWTQDDKGLTITYPDHKPRPAHCSYAYTFKIRVKT